MSQISQINVVRNEYGAIEDIEFLFTDSDEWFTVNEFVRGTEIYDQLDQISSLIEESL
jgi:hypothetical protein